MSMRKKEFANGEFYHIYNRGVDKRDVFMNPSDYERFILSIFLLNNEKDGLIQDWRDFKEANPKAQPWELPRLSLGEPLVDIVTYCLNPNHYHFIIKQLEERGIEKFMHRLGTAYTMFFNKKYKRSGALFQSRFKSIHIDSNDYLLYLSAYVNKNNFIHGYGNSNWKYSSLGEYKEFPKIEPWELKICNPSSILEQFKDFNEYSNFLDSNAMYLKNKKEDSMYLLED